MELVADFERILSLVEELEGVTLAPRVKRRIANAWERSIEKCCVLTWYELTEDDERLRRTLRRHAERGARDFVP